MEPVKHCQATKLQLILGIDESTVVMPHHYELGTAK